MSTFKLTKRRFLQVIGGGALIKCGKLHIFPFDTAIHLSRESSLGSTFYGVGCFGIRYNGVQVLTDPFFSYLSLRQVAFGTVLPDPLQVDLIYQTFTM